MRKATTQDIPLILQRLSELEHPPNVNEDSIASILKQPRSIVMVDGDKICRVAIQFESKMFGLAGKNVQVGWLLPMENISTLTPLLKATLSAMLDKYPQASEFFTWAKFKTGKGCLKNFTEENADKTMVEEWKKLSPSSYPSKPHWIENIGGGWVIRGILKDIIEDL